MARGPREIMRSEQVEGELSGPVNPIPDRSLDCGCGQMRFQKMAKYATRNFYVGLICWIGVVQAAAQAYFGITSSTIARRFNFPPNVMEWVLVFTDGVVPTLLALPIAYWGDRIHRAAWTGALAIIQSVGFLCLIIPHFTHSSSRVIEETTNVTHLSLYADDHPELCATTGLARVSTEEDEICYFTLALVIISQTLNFMATISYFALGISYLDDNTRKRHIGIPLAFIIAFRFIGLLLGYLLAWGCLRVDSEDLTSGVVTYREQMGAWWLGWPILAVLLVVPAIPVSWYPRRLTSEVVEQAAASILDLAGRTSPISESTVSEDAKKYGDTSYLASSIRLLTNKILICNILASVFCTAALVNFASNEDIFLESRFYVPRPSGLLSGFGDFLTSRIVVILIRPILIGVFVIISGIIIVKFRPRAKWLICYNIIIGVVAASVIFALAFANCRKSPIAGSNGDGSISLLRYCNKDCRCSNDADFRPICNEKTHQIFYTPCHAACSGVDDTGDVKKFTGCTCIEEITKIPGNTEGIEGPCESTTCQIGWIMFEISTVITYSLVATGIVGSVLITLRSTFVQDKALAIGLWITLTCFFTYIPGKIIYSTLVDETCIHRGSSSPSSLCHLYHPENLGSYLSFFTALLLLIGVSFYVVTFFLSRTIKLYRESDVGADDAAQSPDQAVPLVERTNQPESSERGRSSPEIDTNLASATEDNQPNTSTDVATTSQTPLDHAKKPNENGPLKYGPLGPGSPRKTGKAYKTKKDPNTPVSESEDSENDEIVNKRAPLSLSTISYKRLELDSDEMSDISGGSPKRTTMSLQTSSVSIAKGSLASTSPQTTACFAKTDDIEYKKMPAQKIGDFNEVGIPIVQHPIMRTTYIKKTPGPYVVSLEDIMQSEKFRLKNEAARSENESSFKHPSRPLSPASSGFESSSSDRVQKDIRYKRPVSRIETANPKLAEDTRNISKSTSNLQPGKPRIHGYTTAL